MVMLSGNDNCVWSRVSWHWRVNWHLYWCRWLKVQIWTVCLIMTMNRPNIKTC